MRPAMKESRPSANDVRTVHESRPRPHSPRHICLVDDDSFSRELLTNLLTERGHSVREFASAAALFRAFNGYIPDVAVIDLNLGDGPTGLDVAAEISARFPDTELIVLTCHRSPYLVNPDAAPLPDRCQYFVKRHVALERLLIAIETGRHVRSPIDREAPVRVITRSQADVLHLIAEGLSDMRIAEERDVSLRAIQRLTGRLYRSLGLEYLRDGSPRARAVEMYFASEVDVQ